MKHRLCSSNILHVRSRRPSSPWESRLSPKGRYLRALKDMNIAIAIKAAATRRNLAIKSRKKGETMKTKEPNKSASDSAHLLLVNFKNLTQGRSFAEVEETADVFEKVLRDYVRPRKPVAQPSGGEREKRASGLLRKKPVTNPIPRLLA